MASKGSRGRRPRELEGPGGKGRSPWRQGTEPERRAGGTQSGDDGEPAAAKVRPGVRRRSAAPAHGGERRRGRAQRGMEVEKGEEAQAAAGSRRWKGAQPMTRSTADGEAPKR